MTKIYNMLLEKYPLPTKALTSGVLFGIGDACTQLIFEKGAFNWKRNINFFMVGCAYIAPCLHFWYCRLLPKIQSIIFPVTTTKTVRVIGSMLIDQLAFAPVLLCGFFPVNQIINDRDIKSFGKGVQATKDKIGQTLINNWKIWPLASTINFWFMPVQYQVLFANFVGLFWNMILSYIASK